MNTIFRIRRSRPGDPNEGSRRAAPGTSDHPDRQFFGKQLEYPEGYDWRGVSMTKLCDPWSDWDGMREIVAEERAKGPSEPTIEMPFDHELSSEEIEAMVMNREWAGAAPVRSEGKGKAAEEAARKAYAEAAAASKLR